MPLIRARRHDSSKTKDLFGSTAEKRYELEGIYNKCVQTSQLVLEIITLDVVVNSQVVTDDKEIR